ncbi:hypothetical protein ACVXHY_22055 [Enterobacter roggenkampii]
MTELTKEWLLRTIAELEEERDSMLGVVNEDAAMALAAMKLALASLEAEAVAWLLSGGGAKNNVSFDSGNAYADPLREVTPLYTAPPAPVSVPDEDLLHMAASAIDDLLSNKDRSGAGVWADIPAKLRRAAMLQGADGNSPVIPDDVRRMDWLVSKTVDVREPMVYGSHSLFWSQTITDEEDDYQATKLREQIDAAMEAEQAAAPQQEAKDV